MATARILTIEDEPTIRAGIVAYLEDSGFYARRAVGWGSYYDPAFVDRWAVGTWASLPNTSMVLSSMSVRTAA